MTRRWPILALLSLLFLHGPDARAKQPSPRLLLWGSSKPSATKWFLVGAVRGAQWSPVAQARKLLGASDAYQVYPVLGTAALPVVPTGRTLAREPGAFAGGTSRPDLDGAIVVKLTGPRMRPGDFLAVSGEPTAMPRPLVLFGKLTPEWRALVLDYLKKKKVRADDLRAIAVRVDLDGDGKQEVLLQGTATAKVATGKGGPTVETTSFLLEVRGKEKPRALIEEQHAASTDRFEDELLGVLDLDGDGTFELLYHHSHFEESRLEVYKKAGAGWRRVLRFDGGV
jgi:hypothetical protein